MTGPGYSWNVETLTLICSKYCIVEQVMSNYQSLMRLGRKGRKGIGGTVKGIFHSQLLLRRKDHFLIYNHVTPYILVRTEHRFEKQHHLVLVSKYFYLSSNMIVAHASPPASKLWKEKLSLYRAKWWMVQALSAVDECHRNMIVHRDLKPANFLVSDDGVLKLADFGQARILVESGFDAPQENPPPYEDDASNSESSLQHPEAISQLVNLNQTVYENPNQGTVSHEEYFRVLDEMKTKSYSYDTDKDTNIYDGNTSCLATCTTCDIDDDLCKGSFTYEAEEVGGNELGCLTSCVGTRWFRAPELLYGSTDYGLEVDLWSLGCVFAELLTSKPLFPGTSDVDQLSRIVSVLGNINEETWPGCSKLPDYGSISLGNVENPSGLEACMPNCSPNEVSLVQRLVCYDPAKRTTAMELLQDKYFSEEPLPVPISELRVPLTRNGQDQDSPGGHNEMGSDSDLEEFGTLNITTTGSDLSIQIP
ncbi:hypothetical protein JHK87_017835 [Glycine soja]|nr:hypothetical protein JHK87_017835 [Glycine soja]